MRNRPAKSEAYLVDPAQAVVPGVKVTLQSVETGTGREITSSPDGQYAFASVPVGIYNVTAETKGFKKAVANGVRVEVVSACGWT